MLRISSNLYNYRPSKQQRITESKRRKQDKMRNKKTFPPLRPHLSKQKEEVGKMGKETTFVLVYEAYILGHVVMGFEKNGFTVIGCNHMTVSENFAKKHLTRDGRMPSEIQLSTDEWVDYVSGRSVAAMLLEGEDVIKRAHKLSLKKWDLKFPKNPPFQFEGHLYYSSDSIKSVEEDSKLWFPDGPDKWSVDCEDCERQDVVCVHPYGKLRSPVDDLPSDYPYRFECDYKHFYTLGMVFVLIKPIAVRDRRFGEILSVLQYHSIATRGLKLVNLNDVCENIAWSADSSSEAFGVALAVDCFDRSKAIVTNKGDNSLAFNYDKLTMKIDRNLIYISEYGKSAWDLIDQYFRFGFVVWPNQKWTVILEASLKGH